MALTGQKYGSCSAKVRHFEERSMVVWGMEICGGVEIRSIVFGKMINRLYMNRSIVFEKSIIHFCENDYSFFWGKWGKYQYYCFG